MSPCRAIRSLATVIFPVTANAMLIGSRLKIRYILIRLISARASKALLDHALKWAESQGYRQMIAVVGDSANVASVALHIRAGFTEIGTLKDIGFKHGRWLDTVLLQMKLGEGNSTLPEGSGLMP